MNLDEVVVFVVDILVLTCVVEVEDELFGCTAIYESLHLLKSRYWFKEITDGKYFYTKQKQVLLQDLISSKNKYKLI